VGWPSPAPAYPTPSAHSGKVAADTGMIVRTDAGSARRRAVGHARPSTPDMESRLSSMKGRVIQGRFERWLLWLGVLMLSWSVFSG